MCAISSAISRVSSRLTDHNTIDDQVNTFSIKRTFTQVFWLSREFVDQFEDLSSDDGAFFFYLGLFLLLGFSKRKVSQAGKYRVVD
jgi:hypothetical protein